MEHREVSRVVVTSRRLGRRVLIVVPAVLLVAGQFAKADTTKVYEWREPNGVVSFSKDLPPAGSNGAVKTREIDTRSFTASQIAAIKSRLARVDALEMADSKRFQVKLETADRNVAVALRQLAQAERSLHDGRTPRAGERLGNAGGGSRLLASYFERQKQLESAVREARTAVEQAYASRSEIAP